MPTGKGEQRNVSGLLQLPQRPVYRGLGQSPPLGQLGIGYQRTACAIAKVGYRAMEGALYLIVPVDRRDSQIQEDVHFRAFLRADQRRGGGDGQEKEAGLLLARAVVVQHGVVPVPVDDPVLYQISPPQQGVLDEVPPLESFQRVQCLAAESEPKRLRQFLHPANPFARVDGVADTVHSQMRGAEVGIGAEDSITKKAGTPVCADAPVGD